MARPVQRVARGTNVAVPVRDRLMNGESTNGITALLRAWGSGDRKALEKVMPLVYSHLHATAQAYMGQQNPGHILQSTALVNETYLRLVRLKEIEWQDRGHFYAVCAQLMRQVLIDYARSRLSRKRGGGEAQVSFDEVEAFLSGGMSAEFIALDDALGKLAALDPRMSQVVQYRLFAGASVEDTAAALHVSERTVKREWHAAQVWLARELDRGKQ